MKTKTYSLNNFYSKPKLNDEDDELEVHTSEPFCAYEKRSHQVHKVTVFLDGPILSARYYRMVASEAADLSENDELEFSITSGGGSMEGLIALLDVVNTTEAEVTAVIKGECHSAASMLAVSCPNIIVSPYASMLVHNASLGAGRAKAYDLKQYVDHSTDFCNTLFRDVYEGFLSEDEIEEVIKGKEMWMGADEISERIQQMMEHKKVKFCNSQGCCGRTLDECDDPCACPMADDCE